MEPKTIIGIALVLFIVAGLVFLHPIQTSLRRSKLKLQQLLIS